MIGRQLAQRTGLLVVGVELTPGDVRPDVDVVLVSGDVLVRADVVL